MTTDGDEREQTEKMAQEAIEEARMVLPGIQALFGFQLIAVFNDRFAQLAHREQVLHFLAIVLIVIAIGLIMTPAAYHRQVEPGSVSKFFVTLASVLVTSAMVPLMCGICIEVFLLGHLALGSISLSYMVAGMLFVFLASAWFLFPAVIKKKA